MKTFAKKETYLAIASLVAGILSVSLMSSVPQAVAAPSQTARKSAIKTAKRTVYVCSMHPEMVALKPGKCPKCKMTLVKKSVASLYTCSMHPEVLALKPGKCPKCGMALTKKK